MSALEKAARARARMDEVRREMSERRALRARNGRAARDRARESLLRQGPVAEQVAKHLGELGRRRRAAGGWATEKTERDTDYILDFGGEDQEQADAFGHRPAPRPRPTVAPGGIGAFDDGDAESAEPAPSASEAPAARRPRRPVAARDLEVLDDEDDFSHQSSWMRNR